VDFGTEFPGSVDDMAAAYDCFYLSSNNVPDADLSLLRSLDPLLASDPGFDPNDMVGGVMSQVQRDGQTWALPLTIQPTAMRYNPEAFSWAGVVPPVNGWTVDEFENALRALSNFVEDEPFQPQAFDNSTLLMLIAAYGGVPMDYSTDPVTINFTDPATVEAIRQVLDLARNGYMTYNELAGVGAGGFIVAVFGGEEPPISTEMTTGRGGGGRFGGGGGPGGRNATSQQTSLLTTFPQGSQYTTMSYDVGAAYISANTLQAEACYQFISMLAQRPDLLEAMPARRSLIDSPDLLAAQGADNIAFYHAVDDLMQRPNAVLIPASSFGRGSAVLGNVMTNYWLNRAFDRYVLEDANLEIELVDAETYTREYLACIAALPPFDPAQDNFQGFAGQYFDCAAQVDPTASGFLGR
jgi:ABC-type glycerol-3-phosphate transport system substrate-binding protein